MTSTPTPAEITTRLNSHLRILQNHTATLDSVVGLMDRGFWGRLAWLVLGR